MNFGFGHFAAARAAMLNGRTWPRAGAPSIDFVAALLTAVLHPQRLLWSRQIEQSSDRTQSQADIGILAGHGLRITFEMNTQACSDRLVLDRCHEFDASKS